ncbi:MAG: ribonuclease HII [Candidatus Saccharimonadales bacterium]
MIGVDEVGRGCWAGPLLVVAARANAELPEGLKDSKLLTKQQREEILNKLSICCNFGEGWVKAAEIDRLGLAHALKLGVKRALASLSAELNEEVIMDGKVNYLPKKFINGQALVDADNLVPIVSAASIYAKVMRDNFMVELAKQHPAYSFDQHVGYGTKTHMLALKTYGALKYVHRYSYQPIAELSGAVLSKQPNRV